MTASDKLDDLDMEAAYAETDQDRNHGVRVQRAQSASDELRGKAFRPAPSIKGQQETVYCQDVVLLADALEVAERLERQLTLAREIVSLCDCNHGDDGNLKRKYYAALAPDAKGETEKEERDAGIIRDPKNGWAIRND